MLDISLMRRDLDAVVARLEAPKSPQPYLDVARFSALEPEPKGLQIRTEELQAKRNALSKQIGAKKGKGEDASAEMAEVQGHAGGGPRHSAAGIPDGGRSRRGAGAE